MGWIMKDIKSPAKQRCGGSSNDKLTYVKKSNLLGFLAAFSKNS